MKTPYRTLTHKAFALVVPFSICWMLQSCGILTNPNANKALNEIVSVYGGTCSIVVGVGTNTYDGSNKYVQLRLKKSKAADIFEEKPSYVTANMAYLFFKDLTPEEITFGKITSTVEFSDGQKIEKDYTVEQLNIAKSKMYIIDNILRNIREHNCAKLQKTFSRDTAWVKVPPIDTLQSFLGRIDEKYGTIDSFQTWGFRMFEVEKSQKKLFAVVATSFRQKGKLKITAIIGANPNDNWLYELDF